jgi:hypothetical protein
VTKHWDNNNLIEWYEKHPVATADDRAFLKYDVENQKRMAVKAMKDSKKETNQLVTIDGVAKKHKSWSGQFPSLPLIHALIAHNNIKLACI